MRKVYLENLPKLSNGNISWKDSVGHKIKFDYNDICGTFEIKDYKTNGVAPQVYISNETNEGWVYSASLIHARLSKFLSAKVDYKTRKKDLIGKRFGKLLVIEDDGSRTDQGQINWKCLCDCGKYTYAISYKLEHGFKTSCGCNAKRYFKPKQSTDIEKRNTAISRIIGRYKSKAKTRNIKWDISKKTFISTIEKPCFYCGIQSSMSLNINGFNYNYNGVDRIDSSKDYTNDNIVPCCKNCNMAKSDLKQKDFYDWVQRISENFTYDKVINE